MNGCLICISRITHRQPAETGEIVRDDCPEAPRHYSRFAAGRDAAYC